MSSELLLIRPIEPCQNVWLMGLTLIYLLAYIILTALKWEREERQKPHYKKAPRDLIAYQREQMIRWQQQVLEDLYQNKFQRKYYLHPKRNKLEEGMHMLYEQVGKEDERTQRIIYYFLKIIAQHSTTLQYLHHWRNSNAIHNTIKAILYWYDKKGIRKIEDWQPERDENIYEYAIDLAGFLFAQYPVIPTLRKAWAIWNCKEVEDFCEQIGRPIVNKEVPDNAMLDFYFYLGDGGSLRKNPFLPWKFSKKMTHWFRESPQSLSWEGAYWWTMFRAEGGSAERVEHLWHLWQHLSYQHIDFWRPFIQQIANEKEAIFKQLDVIGAVETVLMVKFGKLPDGYAQELAVYMNAEPDFTWTKRKLQYSIKYLFRQYTLQYPVPEKFEASYTQVAKKGNCWQFIQLRNRNELFIEGNEMGHCVGEGDYHEDALKGTLSIWSLQAQNENGEMRRRLTIEIEHENGAIVEALGFENREADVEEQKVVRQWAKMHNLEVNVFREMEAMAW